MLGGSIEQESGGDVIAGGVPGPEIPEVLRWQPASDVWSVASRPKQLVQKRREEWRWRWRGRGDPAGP